MNYLYILVNLKKSSIKYKWPIKSDAAYLVIWWPSSKNIQQNSDYDQEMSQSRTDRWPTHDTVTKRRSTQTATWQQENN